MNKAKIGEKRAEENKAELSLYNAPKRIKSRSEDRSSGK
jgi:hypothetical protein